MYKKITVIVFLEGKEENAARRTIDSVFAQRMDFEMQVMVCDLTAVLENAIYDYDECDLIYIPVKEKMPRFELEMALREQIQCPYFTIIDDKEYWTDSEYLQRAVNFLDKKEDFSMYGANAYMECKKDAAYHLKDARVHLYNNDYKENIVFGIEDYMYDLALEEDTIFWLEPAMLVCRNNILNSELEMILAQEEFVQNVYTGRRGMSFLYLKKGMCLMDDRVVAYSNHASNIPKWKRYMQQSLEVYALQYYYNDRLSPKWIWDEVQFECLKGSRELRRWEEQNKGNVMAEDLELLKFLPEKCGEHIEESPLWLQNCGEDNPDKLFMVLQMPVRSTGLFAALFHFLGAVDFAEQNGAYVLIDLKNTYMANLQSAKQRGRENAWEYYFRQPTEEYTLREVYKSKNVIKCDRLYWCNPVWYDMFPVEENTLHKWSGLIKKYFQLIPELQEKCECLYNDKLKKKKRVLGVCVRYVYEHLIDIGTGLSKDHPRQPGLNRFIEEIYKYKEEWNCDWIYVVADDAYALRELQKEFGTQCLYLERKRMTRFKGGEHLTDVAEQIPEGWNIVENNKAYICETYLLSKCTSLLSGNCGCGRMAYYWNDGQYEHVKVFEEGHY